MDEIADCVVHFVGGGGAIGGVGVVFVVQQVF